MLKGVYLRMMQKGTTPYFSSLESKALKSPKPSQRSLKEPVTCFRESQKVFREIREGKKIWLGSSCWSCLSSKKGGHNDITFFFFFLISRIKNCKRRRSKWLSYLGIIIVVYYLLGYGLQTRELVNHNCNPISQGH